MQLDSIVQNLPALFAVSFVAILFIQSGLDKVTDWQGNLGWLSGHFAETPLAKLVPILLGIITMMEIATGVVAAAGFVYYFATGSTIVIFYSAAFGAGTLLALFFGQRMAKDYPGAAVLVPYFLVMLALMALTRPTI